MQQMREEAEALAVSSKLTRVSSGLTKLIISGCTEGILMKFEQEVFNWAGDLWGQVDWDSKAREERRASPEIAVIATNLRSLFYQELRQAGLLKDNSLDRSYMDGVYEMLKGNIYTSLTSEQLRKTQKVIQRISQEILSNLQEAHGGHI